MNLDNNVFYGDDIRWFIGRVVNTSSDPETRGRVQVRIYGIHSESRTDVDDVDLPWAECLVPTTEGGVSGIGRMPQIKPSALVFGIFLDGKSSQSPLVLGSIVQNETPSVVQQQAAAQRGQGREYSASARGSNGTRVSTNARNSLGNNPDRDAKRLAAMTYFVDNGVPAIGAAGIVGNLEAESGFSTTEISKIYDSQGNRTSERSQGIAQWNPAVGRLQNLKGWAAQENKDWQDFFVQCEFVLYEMGIPNGSKTSYNGHGYYFDVGQKVMGASRFEGGVGDDNATWAVIDKYENPSNKQGKLPDREKNARLAYDQYQTTRATAQPDTDKTGPY